MDFLTSEDKRTLDVMNLYYDLCDESTRLSKDIAHNAEFLCVLEQIAKYAPEQCSIFDCCAGKGAYSIELAKRGYNVFSADLLENHVQYIENLSANHSVSMRKISRMDARDMSEYEDEKFDIVLCMGAIYHLRDNMDRRRVLSECARVLKPSGHLFVSYLRPGEKFNAMQQKYRKLMKDAHSHLCEKEIFFPMSDVEFEEITNGLHFSNVRSVCIDGYCEGIDAEKQSLSEYMQELRIAIETKVAIDLALKCLWIGRKSPPVHS